MENQVKSRPLAALLRPRVASASPNPIEVKVSESNTKRMNDSFDDAINELKLTNEALKKIAFNLGKKSEPEKKEEPEQEQAMGFGEFTKDFISGFGKYYLDLTKQLVGIKDVKTAVPAVPKGVTTTSKDLEMMAEPIKPKDDSEASTSQEIGKAVTTNIILGDSVVKELVAIKELMIQADTRAKESKSTELESMRAEKAMDRELLIEGLATRLGDVIASSTPAFIPGLPDLPAGKEVPKTGAPGKTPPKGGNLPKGKNIPKGGGVGVFGGLLLGLGGLLSMSEITDVEKEKEAGNISSQEANKKQAGIVGGFAGAGAGAAIGAGFGSVLMPGIGTAVGAVGGGLLGGILGKEGTEALANTIMNVFSTSNDVKPAEKNKSGAEVNNLTKEQEQLKSERMNTSMGGGGVVNNVVNNTTSPTTIISPAALPVNTEPTFVSLQSRKNLLLV